MSKIDKAYFPLPDEIKDKAQKPTFEEIEQLIIDAMILQHHEGSSATSYIFTRDELDLKKYQSVSKQFWDKYSTLKNAIRAYGCNHE